MTRCFVLEEVDLYDNEEDEEESHDDEDVGDAVLALRIRPGRAR